MGILFRVLSDSVEFRYYPVRYALILMFILSLDIYMRIVWSCIDVSHEGGQLDVAGLDCYYAGSSKDPNDACVASGGDLLQVSSKGLFGRFWCDQLEPCTRPSRRSSLLV